MKRGDILKQIDTTNMKKPLTVAAVITIAVLWMTTFIPTQVAKVTALRYIRHQVEGSHYTVTSSEYAAANDSYMVYLEDKKTGGKRHIGVRRRFFPFTTWYDSEYPG